MKKAYRLYGLFLLLVSNGLVLGQTPPAPAGKVWVLNPEMSDEFGPGVPDEEKWIIYDKADSWDRTAAFDRRVQEIQPDSAGGADNYVLAMNPMWYEDEDIFTKNGRTYYFAGGGMRTREMTTFGYMEVRIKPSDFPMGSGVFMFSREKTPEPCGEAYYSELDIIENFSYTGPGASDWWNGYQHVNTHVWATDASCNRVTPSTQWMGDKRTLEGPLDYNVVGAWWVDKDSVQFYLNGTHWHTIEYLKDSYMPMPLILTMETYTWGSDENNADNPKPEEYMFQDDFRTPEQRAVYYDWVRTWHLVDIDTSEYNDREDNIGFYEDPLMVHEDSVLDISILYSALMNREIAVTIYNKDWDPLGSDTLLSEQGVKSILARVSTDTLLSAGSDYTAICTLRPLGYADGADLASDTVQLIVETKAVETLVMDDGFPKQVYPSESGYYLDVHYQGAEQMEIAVEVRDPSGAWIGGGLKEVPDGKGVARIWAGLIAATWPGKGYYWKTHIRPRGTTWRESVHGLGFIPFQVIEEPVYELDLVSEGWPYMDTVSSVQVSVQYHVLDSADLRIMLIRDPGPPLSDTTLLVEPGSDSLDLDLSLLADPDPGKDYMLLGQLFTQDTDSLLLTDTLKNLEILETEDPVSLSRLEAPVQGEISLFPNPASGSLSVLIPDHYRMVESLTVTDLSGRVLLYIKDPLDRKQPAGIRLDISALPPGYYLMKVKADQNLSIKSFIVN